MGIVPAMIFSILVKGIAAIIELLTQLFISNYMGVSSFGTYTFFVSIIECGYFLLFSGSIKINTFYLSTPSVTIKKFRTKYNFYFVIPIVLLIFLLSLIFKNFYVSASSIIIYIYYSALDRSSIFFARGKQMQALLGEYLVGRIMMLISVVICFNLNHLSTFILLCLFGVQYLTMCVWFLCFQSKLPKGKKDVKVDLHKLYEYQQSDIASSLITYTPTLLQYFSSGAFATGFIGVVSVVRKFVYFISGPTAKVFLPEFSKLYKQNKIDLLQRTYLMIVKVQMVFIGAIGVAVVGYPKLLLSIFNSKLIPYTSLFLLTGICLLFIASLGPVVGILQMTGNEKIATINQWISIIVMAVSWLVLHNSTYFVVYGLCIQAVVEGILEYITICLWMKRFVVSPQQFLKLWAPIVIISIFVNFVHLNNSFIALAISVLIIGVINVIIAANDKMVRESLQRFLNRERK